MPLAMAKDGVVTVLGDVAGGDTAHDGGNLAGGDHDDVVSLVDSPNGGYHGGGAGWFACGAEELAAVDKEAAKEATFTGVADGVEAVMRGLVHPPRLGVEEGTVGTPAAPTEVVFE